MDSYYPDDNARDGLRREVMRIVADDDEAAITEAKRLDSWKQSSFYEIRAIKNSARSGDKVIFSTRVEEPAAEDAEQ
jgi:hypothetical protein